MTPPPTLECWFLTGSQELNGEETLDRVAAQARTIADAFDKNDEASVTPTMCRCAQSAFRFPDCRRCPGSPEMSRLRLWSACAGLDDPLGRECWSRRVSPVFSSV